MKICVMIQNLYTLGGVQRVVVNLLDDLSKRTDIDITILMPRKGIHEDITLYSLPKSVKVDDFNEYFISQDKTFGRLLLAVNKRLPLLDNNLGKILIKDCLVLRENKKNLADYINKRGYDVVIGAGWNYSLMLGAIKNLVDCRLVGWQHNTYESYFETRGINAYGLSNCAQEYYKLLDDILVLTIADKKKFDKKLNLNTKVLYNPVGFPSPTRENYSNSRLLFLGRLSLKQKGLDYLIEILKVIKLQIPDFECLVVGDGPDKTWLKNSVEKAGLYENVKLIGSTNDVYSYYNSCAIMLQTSRWEGFGLTVVEGMSTGISVVSFENNGPCEIITHDKDGFLIPKYNIELFAKSIIELMRNIELRKTIGENAKRRALDFSISNISPIFLSYLAGGGKQ